MCTSSPDEDLLTTTALFASDHLVRFSPTSPLDTCCETPYQSRLSTRPVVARNRKRPAISQIGPVSPDHIERIRPSHKRTISARDTSRGHSFGHDESGHVGRSPSPPSRRPGRHNINPAFPAGPILDSQSKQLDLVHPPLLSKDTQEGPALELIKSPSPSKSPHDRDKATGEDPLIVRHMSRSDYDHELLLEPETRQITEDQLRTEVNGIYRGVFVVEQKCIAFDSQQAITKQSLKGNEWNALISLHQTYLNECHDFFLATQHPAAGADTRQLPARYELPRRMWLHGIHSFLEVLRMKLDENSKEYMLRFIVSAYSMLILLVESVPLFQDVWIECLGDIARYRMMVVEHDHQECLLWTCIARDWYNKAANSRYTEGRIQHHLAVLAPDLLQQFFLFTKALVSIRPFPNARANLETLCNSLVRGPEIGKAISIDETFSKIHAVLFLKGSGPKQAGDEPSGDMVPSLSARFEKGLDSSIGRLGAKWREPGVYVSLINIAALFDYGDIESPLLKTYTNTHGNDDLEGCQDKLEEISGRYVCAFTFRCLSIVTHRVGDRNVLPHMHVSLAFIWTLVHVPKAIRPFEHHIPWPSICHYVSDFSKKRDLKHFRGPDLRTVEFPHQVGEKGVNPYLPEDFLMCGEVWSWYYHPKNFFDNVSLDDEERSLERPSMLGTRIERCLWLAFRIASVNRWITFDDETQEFRAVFKVAETKKALA